VGIAGSEAYEKAVKKLFPQGGYWDARFADSESGASLFAQTKAGELARFRSRMDALKAESVIETADELIAEWERVLLGYVTAGLPLNERRLLLKSKRDARLNRAELRKIAGMHGLSIRDIVFPFRPAFFGHARFAMRNGSPAVFSALLFHITGNDLYKNTGEKIKAEFPASGFGRPRLGGDRVSYFPAHDIKRYVYQSLRAGAAGFFKCGKARLIPSPVYKIRPVIEKRLRAASFGFSGFGASRLVCSPMPRFRQITAERVCRARFGAARFGRDRLMYTTAYHIKRAVYDWFRASGAGFIKCGTNRLFFRPADLLFRILRRQWRPSCFGSALFGHGRLCLFNGGFSNALLPRENEFGSITSAAAQKEIVKSGVVWKCDPKIVNAIIAVSGILPRRDATLVKTLLRENGLMKRFDDYTVNGVIQARQFFPRFEHLLANRYIRLNGVFNGFETAMGEKPLAGQKAYFNYEGE
jgi:hypothetical protein